MMLHLLMRMLLMLRPSADNTQEPLHTYTQLVALFELADPEVRKVLLHDGREPGELRWLEHRAAWCNR